MDLEALSTHIPRFRPAGDPDSAASRQAELDRHKAEFLARGGQIVVAERPATSYVPSQKPIKSSHSMLKREAQKVLMKGAFYWHNRTVIYAQVKYYGLDPEIIAREVGIATKTLQDNLVGKNEAGKTRAEKIEVSVQRLLQRATGSR